MKLIHNYENLAYFFSKLPPRFNEKVTLTFRPFELDHVDFFEVLDKYESGNKFENDKIFFNEVNEL